MSRRHGGRAAGKAGLTDPKMQDLTVFASTKQLTIARTATDKTLLFWNDFRLDHSGMPIGGADILC